MKKFLSLALVLMLTMAVVLTGCGKKEEQKEGQATGETGKPLKMVLLINGTLGDKSFFDSANAGMELIKKELGAETKTIEMSYDKTKWLPTLEDVSEQDYDLIIVGTWEMVENLQKVAAEHPDKKYVIFDTDQVNYKDGANKNIYSIAYKQNEGSFLAGALAAKVTQSNLPNVSKEKVVGFLGGMDIPVINDFLVGYIQGAQYVDKDVKVAISYVGDFANSAKGKEMTLAQFNNQKVDISFGVAGQAGLGLIDAAKETKKYAIGVDSDQAMAFKASDPDKANLICTSVLKRVDNSLLRTAKLYKEGTLKFGEVEYLGFKEDCIAIAENEFYNKIVSEDIRNYVASVKEKILSGEIKVDTAIGMETATLNKIRNAVKP